MSNIFNSHSKQSTYFNCIFCSVISRNKLVKFGKVDINAIENRIVVTIRSNIHMLVQLCYKHLWKPCINHTNLLMSNSRHGISASFSTTSPLASTIKQETSLHCIKTNINCIYSMYSKSIALQAALYSVTQQNKWTYLIPWFHRGPVYQ
jgi:aspartate ammonia-lyase